VLAANSGLVLIDAADNSVKPNKVAPKMLELPEHEFAKRVYNDYMSKNNIYETHYITYIRLFDGEGWVPWHECRKEVVDLLKTCPVGKFVQYADFQKYMEIFHKKFFRKHINRAVYLQGYDFGDDYYGGYNPDWYECDDRIIQTILEFLGVIGVIDIAYKERVPWIRCAGGDFYIGVAGFNITPLGAWLLGLHKEYAAPKKANAEGTNTGVGLTVNDDNTVVITGLKERIKHEIYLSRFLTKIESDENNAVYLVDFPAIVKAYDMGVEPREVYNYLERESKTPMPKNLSYNFRKWQMQVGRLKIRTVTILESDDEDLLTDFLENRTIHNQTVEAVKNAVIINDGSKKKVKAALNKEEWLVDTR
jgi:hypothetical protein